MKAFPGLEPFGRDTKLYVTLLSAPFDPADYFKTPETVAPYPEAFFDDGVDGLQSSVPNESFLRPY